MRWVFILLSFILLSYSIFSEERYTFRETIARYGYTDKDSIHSYVEPYERLLKPFVDKSCNVLEIGVNFGGSAIMWYKHLPKSKLFLLDNRDVMVRHIKGAMNPKRWNLYVEDAYIPEVVDMMREECPSGFDLIIDDGPHSFESQKFVITNYLSLLNRGGLLIIEDIQHGRDIEILKQYVPASPEFEVEIIDLRKIKGRYDDILFVVRKL